jgi:hypothetical protein
MDGGLGVTVGSQVRSAALANALTVPVAHYPSIDVI